MEKERIIWVDTAKFLGIVMIYFLHTEISRGINSFICVFDMPFFYILSGFCWNREKYREMDFLSFIKLKFNGLIIPYLRIAFCCLVVWGLFYNVLKIGVNEAYFVQILKYLFGILVYSRGTIEWLPNCSPIWFLTSLFIGEIIVFFILKCKNKSAIYILFFVIFIMAFLLSNGNKLPYNIDNGFTAAPFILGGVFLKKKWYWINHRPIVVIIALITVSIVISYFIDYLGADYDGNKFKNFFITILCAFILSVTLIILISRIPNSYFLPIMGKNTLFLMGYNYLFRSVGKVIAPEHSMILFGITLLLGILSVLLLNRYSKIKKIFV